MKWISCEERFPEDMETVIVYFEGWWPGRGMGGITGLYRYDGDWFNYPEGVKILGWIPCPDDYPEIY